MTFIFLAWYRHFNGGVKLIDRLWFFVISIQSNNIFYDNNKAIYNTYPYT